MIPSREGRASCPAFLLVTGAAQRKSRNQSKLSCEKLFPGLAGNQRVSAIANKNVRGTAAIAMAIVQGEVGSIETEGNGNLLKTQLSNTIATSA